LPILHDYMRHNVKLRTEEMRMQAYKDALTLKSLTALNVGCVSKVEVTRNGPGSNVFILTSLKDEY